jgi:hypothetical protein
MKLVLSLLVVAVSLTALSICGHFKCKGEPKDIAFPNEIKCVEQKTSTAYLNGCAAATGEGTFIITWCETTALQAGQCWKSRGVDRVNWGDILTFYGTSSYDRPAEIRCDIEIPEILLKYPTRVRGYLLVEGIYAERNFGGSFRNTQGSIKSNEFTLCLYPKEMRKSATVYSNLRHLWYAAIISWIIVWIVHNENKQKKKIKNI